MSRRIWFALDTLFLADPKVAELGAEYGPGGPLAVIHMLSLAKLGHGSFYVSPNSLARAAFLAGAQEAADIISRAVELDVLTPSEENGYTFTAWDRWQKADPTAATRQARYRERKQVSAETVHFLFDYWRRACQHPQAKLTSDRRSKLEARIRDGYTPDQITRAIDGAAAGAFTNDDGKRFDDLELICRNGSKLESFIERAPRKRNPKADADRLTDAYE